ncbi:MAG: hypothetical protein IJT95_06615 [Abditibacteriota bacterium]|nr:hypothetical protein [Abditibacteriota bacterium]
MKNCFIIAIIVVCLCSGAVYAAFTLDPEKDTLRIERIRLDTTPDYLLPVIGETEDIYRPEINTYSRDISKAKLIYVAKRLSGISAYDQDRSFLYYGGSFLSDNNEDIDKMCKTIPLVKRVVKYDRFEVLEYDANDKINYIDVPPSFLVLSVVKDRGKTIWYFEGHPFRDIAITADGRYMIVTDELVFYATADDKRIVSELYGGNRIYLLGIPRPADIRILTDNIIRVSYKSGLVEHWKVRLSEEDIEKNMEKYKTDEKHLADKCLLWSNGKGKPYKSQAMWCYDESDQEPVYDNTNLADITADISDLQKSASVSAPEKGPNEKAAAALSGNGAGEAAATD